MMSALFAGSFLQVRGVVIGYSFAPVELSKCNLGWDYMIGNSETAYNKVASLVMGFKESILEEKERKKEERNWKRISLRILANLL